jgi:UDP-N-acetylmuramate--alanine ligase
MDGIKEIASKGYIHLVGIGGVGMSGLALLLKEKGFKVRGSDIKESRNLEMLRKRGIEVFVGHKKENITPEVRIVCHSSAIREDNLEIKEAKERGIPVLKRSKLLNFVCEDKKVIAVSGSHGKTTVTALLSYFLTSLGYQPTVFVGGFPLNYSTSSWWSDKDYFVVETDESDGSFLDCFPWVSIITNIDKEHLDYYENIENLKESFLKFAYQTKELVIGWGDDCAVKQILKNRGGINYGFCEDNKVRAKNFYFDGKFSCFDLFIEEEYVSKIKIPLLGEHNVLNTLGVLSFFYYLKEDLKKVIELLKDFKGTKRRFQIKAKIDEVIFVDDYAHHPTEIKMVLKSARYLNPKRVLVIFEPHRFSRIRLLWREFSSCFSLADELIVTDIYSAYEEKIPGIDGKFIFEKIREKFSGIIRYIPKKELVEKVPLYIKKKDLVIGLGAGEINLLMEEIIDEFKRSKLQTQC